MITIKLDQVAHAINTRTRIVPLLISHVVALGESHWVIRIPYGDCVKYMFPCYMYTIDKAVDEFCRRNDIDRQNVITQIEEEN